MSDKRFNAVLTAAGEQAIAQAIISGLPAAFAFMAVGDGGGSVPDVDSASRDMVREVYRAKPNGITLADGSNNIVQAEIIIPPQVGGFTVREAALYGDDGACLAVANLPETYKPLLAEGAGRYQVVRIWLAVSNTAGVQLTLDPSVIIATADQVKKAQAAAQDYTDEVAHTLNDTLSDNLKSAIAEAVKTAARNAWEDDNPVGTVRLFQQNVNPNAKWPWSIWTYLGENKTLRLGKQDGTDVFKTGGADSIQLTKSNLPNVQIEVSGTAADTDLGTRQTQGAGGHGHPGKFGESNTSIDGGTATRRSWGTDYDMNNEGMIGTVADHQHGVALGAHGHGVSGKTAALGSAAAIDITNSFVKLMGWYRTA